MIAAVGLEKGNVFIDLGSGIGNVVCQVAAQCLAESYGVEIQDRAAELAKDLSAEYLNRIKYAFCLIHRAFNRPCGKIGLIHASFLDSPELDLVIPRADVLLINNYIFSPMLYDYS
jgi:H3 lysine-79-specific histone-lysine N-methyltransferase